MIDWWNAIWAGLVGAIVMAMMMMGARKAGLSVANMPRYLGCMFTGDEKGVGPFMTGMVAHLIISALIAVVYAWGFEAVWGSATWLTGLTSGVIHWLIAGLVVAMMDGMNPCVRGGRIQGFGFFGKNYGGVMVMGFLMGHLVFGAIVGWLYEIPSV